MKNKGTLLVVLATGVAFGAALGMLFTPHSGSFNRRIIKRKGEAITDEVIESITEPIEQLGDSITEHFETMKTILKSKFGV